MCLLLELFPTEDDNNLESFQDPIIFTKKKKPYANKGRDEGREYMKRRDAF
jgi:hypothetical protein